MDSKGNLLTSICKLRLSTVFKDEVFIFRWSSIRRQSRGILNLKNCGLTTRRELTTGFVSTLYELGKQGARRHVLREVPNFSLKEFKTPRKRPRRGITPPASAPEKTSESSTPAPPQQSEGLYELNPLMTRMINAELQDVMIMVWQAIPDEPESDADKLVAEKFRGDGGDDFRDVLGLNVAQRLLQIFNKLTLRIQFSSPPHSTSLRTFLRRYSFVSFKRVEGTSRTFIAQVKYIADFDTLCSIKDLRCGSAKVVITPLYKFNQCPEKLKPTSFDKTRPKTDIKDIRAKEPQKVEKDANVTKLPQKIEDTKVNQAKSGTQVKPPASNTSSKPTQAKPNTAANSAKTTLKPQSATQTKPQTTPTQAEVNTTQAKTQATPTQAKANTTQAKPQATPTQAKANTTQAKSQATLTQAKANTTQAKPETTPTQAKANNTQAKPQATPTQAKVNTTQAKPQATPTQAKANTTQAKPQATPIQSKANITQAKNTQVTPTQAKPNTQATSQSKPNTPVVSQPKPNTSATSQAKPNTTTASQAKANVPASPAKPQQAKPATPTQAKNTPAAKTQTKLTQTKPAPKTQAKLAQAKPTPATPKTQTKQAKPNQAKIKISPQSKSARKSFKEKGDFDELDDHDILALMSGGIVLDECIGSDEE